MFIRAVKKKVTTGSTSYEYIQHRLVESIRTDHGPRQRTILNLGTLPYPAEQLKMLADLIENTIKNTQQSLPLFGDPPPEIVGQARHFADIILQKKMRVATRASAENPSVIPPEQKPEPTYESIDPHSIITSDSRTIGVEHIVLSQIKELDFFSILEECSFTETEKNHAVAQICGRMAHPASERETARWVRKSSALAELLDADFSHMSDQTLHRIADTLAPHLDYIEKRLSEKSDDLFSLDNMIILYDLTNTWFESPKRRSALATYGVSKEKRADCPLLTLALVVDAKGFPKRSRILAGNVSEPHTLWDTLEKLESVDTSDTHPRTVVIDAGSATEENLAKLRADKRFEYVAISRTKKFPGAVFDPETARSVMTSHKKELTIIAERHGDETLLLCKSPDRARKDAAIHSLRKERFEKGLRLLNEQVKKSGAAKKSSVIHERIGRLKQRCAVGHCYTIDVKETDGIVREIAWRSMGDHDKKFGDYLIRTSRTDLADTEISLIHRTLTMIESAFRWLKSDRGVRPNFHQKDIRMSTHARISVLAYFFLAPILHTLEWGGRMTSCCGKHDEHAPWDRPFGWHGLVRIMESQTRVTTSFQCEDGKRMDVRTTVEPTAEQLDIYKRLKMSPRPLKRIISKQ